MRWSVSHMGIAVQPILEKGNTAAAFHVQAVFRRSVHLRCGNGDIVSLVDGSIGAGPSQLVVAVGDGASSFSPLGIVEPGQTLVWNRPAQCLEYNREYRFDLSRAVVWKTDVFTSVTRREALNALQSLSCLPAVPLSDAAFLLLGQQLIIGIKTDRGKQAESAVIELLGRGQGLTPTGDDILFGFYSGLLLIRHLPEGARLQKWIDACGGWILEHAPARTTLLSCTLLKQLVLRQQCADKWSALLAAHKGQAGEEERDAALDVWLQTGHSSGSDTLFGLKLALQAVQALN